jgi:hypothetical protein
LLGAVAFVAIEMAFALHQNLAALGQQAHAKVIGQGAGGDKDRGLLSEHLSHALFQFGDNAAL